MKKKLLIFSLLLATVFVSCFEDLDDNARPATSSEINDFIYRGLNFGIYDTVKPIFIGEGGSFMASFLLGWAVTVVSGLASYPIDTIRRRMMMTSGTGK